MKNLNEEAVPIHRIRNYLLSFHPIVLTLVLGTVLARIATSMSLPFLALYLALHAHMSPVEIGVITGIGSLSGTLGGFVGGTLSDRLGRKKVMMGSIYVWGIVFVGFAISSNAWQFFVLNVLNGLCRSFFEPVSQALMGDLTEPEKRYRVFSLRYIGANAGVAIGPMIGALLGISAGATPFLITGGIYLVYAVVLQILLTRLGLQNIEGPKKEHVTIRGALRTLSRDVTLRLFLIGGILAQIGYVQSTVTLSQHVNNTVAGGVTLYAWLMTTNALCCVLMQLPISLWAENRPPFRAILIGNLLYAIGDLGFAYAQSWTWFIVSMIVFTAGEVLTFPAGNVLIDRLAPEDLRGSYYGASSFRDLGRFIGPWIGGLLLAHYGGSALFDTVAVITLFGSYFYWAGLQRSKHLFELPTDSKQASL